MKNKKNILVVGTGILGCLTAVRIALKFKDCNVLLVSADNKILKSNESIKLGKFNINNGFHAIDAQRCPNLLKFLSEKLKIKFFREKLNRFILINGEIERERSSLKDKNKKFKNFFKIGNLESKNLDTFIKYSNHEFKNIINKIKIRFSPNIQDSLHFYVPWFYPREYILKSKDEGIIYRNFVDEKNIYSEIAIPKKFLFSSFDKYFLNTMKKLKNLTVLYNTKVKIGKKILLHSKNDEIIDNSDVVFLCYSPIDILKQKFKNDFYKITKNERFLINGILSFKKNKKYKQFFNELLILDQKFIQLHRISKCYLKNKDKNKNYLQFELIIKTNEIKKFNKKFISSCFKKFFQKIEYENIPNNIKIEDYKISRKMFFSKLATRALVANKLEKYFYNQNKKVVYNKVLGPLNMSKSWNFSEKNLHYLKNDLSR